MFFIYIYIYIYTLYIYILIFYQQPDQTYGYKHARLVSAMQILEAKLNDSDVKFKIYYKYGNATSKEPYLNAFS